MAMKVVVFTILFIAIIMPATAFAQNATSFTMDREERSDKGDVILLSQRYNNEQYGDEIVGEVRNNGSVPVDFVEITVTFYDENHNITGTDFTFSDPHILVPGMKAPFKFYLTDGSSTEDADTYEFSLSWNNPDGTTGSKFISQKLLTQADDDNDGEDSSDSNGNDNSNGNSDGNCDASYPTVCIESPPPNLNCDDVREKNFEVIGRDPHGFDRDNDGFGCDSATGGGNESGNENRTKPPICPVNPEGECPPVPPVDPPDPCDVTPDAEECDGGGSEGDGGGDTGGDTGGGDGDGGGDTGGDSLFG
jgi:hypothetical protein